MLINQLSVIAEPSGKLNSTTIRQEDQEKTILKDNVCETFTPPFASWPKSYIEMNFIVQMRLCNYELFKSYLLSLKV